LHIHSPLTPSQEKWNNKTILIKRNSTFLYIKIPLVTSGVWFLLFFIHVHFVLRKASFLFLGNVSKNKLRHNASILFMYSSSFITFKLIYIYWYIVFPPAEYLFLHMTWVNIRQTRFLFFCEDQLTKDDHCTYIAH
jgi:hypothetical protein